MDHSQGSHFQAEQRWPHIGHPLLVALSFPSDLFKILYLPSCIAYRYIDIVDSLILSNEIERPFFLVDSRVSF